MVAAALVLRRRLLVIVVVFTGVALAAGGCGRGARPSRDGGAAGAPPAAAPSPGAAASPAGGGGAPAEGTSGGEAPAPEAPSTGGGELSWAERVQWGKSIYRANCAACHGEDGQGASSVPLARPDLLEKYPTDEALIARIRDGDAAAGMPPCANDLQPEHLQALAAYIRLLSESMQ